METENDCPSITLRKYQIIFYSERQDSNLEADHRAKLIVQLDVGGKKKKESSMGFELAIFWAIVLCSTTWSRSSDSVARFQHSDSSQGQ